MSSLSLRAVAPKQQLGTSYNAPAGAAGGPPAAGGINLLKESLEDKSANSFGRNGIYKGKDGNSITISPDDVAADKQDARKKLEKLTPVDRRNLLRQAKLAASLRSLPEVFAKEGKDGGLNKAGFPKVEKGRIEVQVWLNALSEDGLAMLKAAGFDLAATILKDKLLLGSISVAKLDALIELGFVRRVDLPRLK